MKDYLDLIARLFVATYFLWAVWFNIRAKGHHLAEFKRIGFSDGAPFFCIGSIVQTLGALLLLFSQTAVWGAVMIIIFTLAADALFHRYWTYEKPDERVIHQFFLYEHVALVGGLLAVIALHL